jgi:hypothetical protein
VSSRDTGIERPTSWAMCSQILSVSVTAKTKMLSWLACTILQTGDMSAVQFVRCKFMMYATMSLISAAVSGTPGMAG